MSTIILNRKNARLFVNAALSAASTDDITPVICGAHVSIEDGMLRVTATDRYRVHTALIDTMKAPKELDAIIPRTALMWLRSNEAHFGSRGLDEQRISIDVKPHPDTPQGSGALIVTVLDTELADSASVSWSGLHTRGHFPPVRRLLESARNAESTTATPLLNLSYVAKVQQLARNHVHPIRVKFTASDNPNKPGPVYFSVEADGGGVVAEALIQPHLEPRR